MSKLMVYSNGDRDNIVGLPIAGKILVLRDDVTCCKLVDPKDLKLLYPVTTLGFGEEALLTEYTTQITKMIELGIETWYANMQTKDGN